MFGNIKKFFLTGLALLSLSIATPVLAHALNCAGADAGTAACQIQGGVKTVGGVDPGTAGTKVHNTLTNIINVFSLIIGIIAVIVMIIAGLTYITSGGNEQKVSSAKSTIIYAVVGLIVVAFAQIIVRFVVNKFK